MKRFDRFRSRAHSGRRSQQGYLLLVILLMLALLMIALVAVAPRIAQQIRRDREEETVRRGTQYVRAIRLFYRKFGRYPTSIDELLSTNNIRFLRKKYKDPLSPNGEWRLIHLGEARVTPTGFGAQPSGGAAAGQAGGAGGAGGIAGSFGQPSMMSGGLGGSGQPGNAPGTSGGLGQAATTPDTLGGAGQSGTPASGGSQGSSSSGSSSSGSSSSSSSSSGSTFGGGAIVGVAPLNNGVSIKELNGKNHYNDWEFVYDPRLDPTNRGVVAPGVGGSAGAPGTLQGGPQPGPPSGPPPGGAVTQPPMNPR